METKGDDAERWAEARAIFLELAELEPQQRRAQLESLAARDPELAAWVGRLLAQDDGGVPDGPRVYGPYEELRPIASGGMGDVVLARRVDGEFERVVAIKLLKAFAGGEDLVQRFLRERQTLAGLDHEYIARLLDGGTTPDGRPYLVMEYVEGEPLDAFCRGRNLDVAERVRLFLRVCAAVQHAHERGVIHRDLKPNNILVRADGTPRLLDFGIARPRDDDATPGGPLTRTGHRLFTPEYASPEQVRGDEVTEATDVFALGVLLYRLLADAGPWGAGGALHELERDILERDPVPPSRRGTGTARRRLAGDLDTITLKCLAKRPAERYASVAHLAEDLERHLAGYPIRARRTGTAVRAWRYARRQPWRMVGLAAVVVALLAGGAAWRERDRSSGRRGELIAAIETQVESARVFRDQGKLDRAEQELLRALDSVREMPEEGYLSALVMGQLGVLDNWRRNFSESLDWNAAAREVLPDADPRAAELRASLLTARAYALSASGAADEAWEAVHEALAWCRAELAPGHELTVDALLGLSDQRRNRGENELALEGLGVAATEARASGDPRDEGLGRALNLWGLALADVGRHDDAIEKLREAREILGWHYGEGHPSIAQVRENLGESLYRLGRYDESEEQHTRALETHRELELEAKVAASLAFLGRVHLARGELDPARESLEQALAIRVRLAGERHAVVRRNRYWLACVADEAGDADDARAALARVLDDGLGWAGPLRDEHEGGARLRLGRLLHEGGDPAAARPELERALELFAGLPSPELADPSIARELLAD
ncbi:MAG: serine/threonine-protein kinase [Planctomycetota bacterium]